MVMASLAIAHAPASGNWFSMAIFSVLVLGLLVIGFLVVAVGFVRSLVGRQYLIAALHGVLLLPFVVYFVFAMPGMLAPRSPDAVFRYALGFSPPAGISVQKVEERQGFHPGVDVFLRLHAPADAFERVLVQARLKAVNQSHFAQALSNHDQPTWWQPATTNPLRFWHSSDFTGPYAFPNAYLASAEDGTVWAFVTALE